MDWSSLQDAITGGAVALVGTATTFGQGAIASSISGNPYYSNDPASAAYATQGLASTRTGNAAGGSNLLLIGLIIFVVVKLAK